VVQFEDIDWTSWIPDQEATLLYVVRNGSILMIHKRRGLGAGKINAPGGRIDAGESPLAAAVREFAEELAVHPTGVRKCGEILFHVLDGISIRIHVFKGGGCTGQPQETSEAIPFWVPVDNVPYDQMWADDRHWLPLLLQGRSFKARTLFAGDQLLGHDIEVMPAGFSWH
jgi:8-oxo-dGTP diphosphatase